MEIAKHDSALSPPRASCVRALAPSSSIISSLVGFEALLQHVKDPKVWGELGATEMIRLTLFTGDRYPNMPSYLVKFDEASFGQKRVKSCVINIRVPRQDQETWPSWGSLPSLAARTPPMAARPPQSSPSPPHPTSPGPTGPGPRGPE